MIRAFLKTSIQWRPLPRVYEVRLVLALQVSEKCNFGRAPFPIRNVRRIAS